MEQTVVPREQYYKMPQQYRHLYRIEPTPPPPTKPVIAPYYPPRYYGPPTVTELAPEPVVTAKPVVTAFPGLGAGMAPYYQPSIYYKPPTVVEPKPVVTVAPERLVRPIPEIPSYVPTAAEMERRYGGMPPEEVLPVAKDPWELMGISKGEYLTRYTQSIVEKGGGEYIKRIDKFSPATARKMTQTVIDYWKAEPEHLKNLNKELEPDLTALSTMERELNNRRGKIEVEIARGLINQHIWGLTQADWKVAQQRAKEILNGELQPDYRWLPEKTWEKVKGLINEYGPLQEDYMAKLSEVLPKVEEYEGRYNQFVSISKETKPGVFEINPKVQEIATRLTPLQTFSAWMEIPIYGALGVVLGAGIGAGLAALKISLATKFATAAARIPLAGKIFVPVGKVISPVAKAIFKPQVMYPVLGTYEAYRAYQMYEAGVSLDEIARTMGKEIAFIVGFGWGFGKGLKAVKPSPKVKRPKIRLLEPVKTKSQMKLGPEEEFRIIHGQLYKLGKPVRMGDPIFYKRMPWASLKFEVSGKPVRAGWDIVPFSEPAQYYTPRSFPGGPVGITKYIPSEQIVYFRGQLFTTTGIKVFETTARIGALEFPFFKRGLTAQERVVSWLKYEPKPPIPPVIPFRTGLGKAYWAKFDKWYQELQKASGGLGGGYGVRSYQQLKDISLKAVRESLVLPTPTAPVQLYVPVVEPSLMVGVGPALGILSSVLLGTAQVTKLAAVQKLDPLRATSVDLAQAGAQTVGQIQFQAQAQALASAQAQATAQAQAQAQVLAIIQPRPVVRIKGPIIPPYPPEVREWKRRMKLRREWELAELRRRRYFDIRLILQGVAGRTADVQSILRTIMGGPVPTKVPKGKPTRKRQPTRQRSGLERIWYGG